MLTESMRAEAQEALDELRAKGLLIFQVVVDRETDVHSKTLCGRACYALLVCGPDGQGFKKAIA